MEEDVNSAAHKLLLVGGSAGSLEAILAILPRLQLQPLLAIVIVLHRKGGDDSNVLASLLKERTGIPVKEAEEKEPLRGGNIYIAPGDYHLLVEKDKTFSLDYSEKVHFSRPSIDVSFQTGAEAFGKDTVGILLSGASRDGTDGLKAIKEAGGITVVQAPASSVVEFMPAHALKHAAPGRVLDIAGIAGFINQL